MVAFMVADTMGVELLYTSWPSMFFMAIHATSLLLKKMLLPAEPFIVNVPLVGFGVMESTPRSMVVTENTTVAVVGALAQSPLGVTLHDTASPSARVAVT